jgi:hypothetical protein
LLDRKVVLSLLVRKSAATLAGRLQRGVGGIWLGQALIGTLYRVIALHNALK